MSFNQSTTKINKQNNKEQDESKEQVKQLEYELYHKEYHYCNTIPWYRIINNELLVGRNKSKILFNIADYTTSYKRNEYIDYICNKQGYVDVKLTRDTKIYIYYTGQHRGVDIEDIDINREPLKMSVCNQYVMNDFHINNTRVIIDIRENISPSYKELVISFVEKYCKQVVIFI